MTSDMTGVPPQTVPPPPPPVPVASDGKAVASLVLGILSIFGHWLGIGIVLGICAIVFSRRARKPSGMATAGLVLGIIGIVVTALVLIISLSIGPLESFSDRSVEDAVNRGQRAQSENNVRQLVLATLMYLSDYYQVFPDDIEQLMPYVNNDRRVLINPLHPECNIGYVYVGYGVPLNKIENISSAIVIFENYETWPEEGIACGFLDGHVSRVTTEASFEKLLESVPQRVPGSGTPPGASPDDDPGTMNPALFPDIPPE